MPREITLRCDIDDCGSKGTLYEIGFDARAYELILCPHHLRWFRDILAKGRPLANPTRPPVRRAQSRTTNRARLESLFEADKH